MGPESPDKVARSSSLREVLAKTVALLDLLRPFHGALIKGALLGPVIGLLAIVPPWITKWLFDRVAITGDIDLLEVLVLALVTVGVVSVLAETVLSFYSSYLNTKLENLLILHVFNHLQHLPERFYRERQIGEVLSRLGDARGSLAIVSGFLSLIFGQGIYLLMVPPFLFLLDWRLASIALITVPIAACMPILSGRFLRRAWHGVIGAHAAWDALRVETLQQLRTLRSLASERLIYRRAVHRVEQVLGHHLYAQRYLLGLRAIERVLDALSLALFTWLGWRFILAGEISVGDYVAFLAYLAYLRGPFVEFLSLLGNLQQTSVHLDRVFEILDEEPEQDPRMAIAAPSASSRSVKTIERIEGHIRVEGLTFCYRDGEPVLRDLDLEIEAGEVLAVVGASGSGKTTLLRLLNRTETAASGRILVGGRDVQDWNVGELRRQIGVVWQDVALMHGTVEENLVWGLGGSELGETEVDKAAIEDALRLCAVDDVVAELPLGLGTPVAEVGASLSGGQRQRLALARAVLRQAPILLLDEVTSNVDALIERRIVPALFARARRRGQTVVFVTHRLATARLADRIAVLERGRLAGIGDHPTLLTTSDPYRRLLGSGESKDEPVEAPEEMTEGTER